MDDQLFPKKENFSLNDAQLAAAHAPMGPLLIIAGAGTGKTRTLTSRIIYFIEQGIKPERICAITFTNKAAKEMADRVGHMVKHGQKMPYIGTFHSLGARILRKECHAVGRDFNFTIFDDHDSADLIKKILKPVAKSEDEDDGVGPGKKKEAPAFFIGEISKTKNLGNDVLDSRPLRPGDIEPARVASVISRYEAALQENNAFDFDDLIEKVVSLFKSNPHILEKYQNMFDAILVDEYQDINPKQHEFIKLLAGKHRNLSVVGDDEQTIYGWRYADITIFLNFEREWPGAKIHFLEENYRSTGAIIRGASGVVKNNRVRAPKNLFTKNPDGELISLYEAWSEGEEAAWVVDQIKKNNFLGKKENIAILYRTNAQSRAIEQALIRNDISYRVFGGLKFYERREVKDAVAGLRYVANPRDVISRERLEKNLTKKKFAAFRARIDEVKDIKPTEALAIFLETYDYLEYLKDNFPNSDERQENIAELTSFVASFDSMSDLLEKLSLLQSTDDEQANKNKGFKGAELVTLMTVHMAKGLEFDNVFIIGAAEGLMPHIRSIDKELQVEEERRLMYVAMTRARKRLFISFYGMPSRFVGEIPEDCIKLVTASDVDGIDISTDDEDVIYF